MPVLIKCSTANHLVKMAANPRDAGNAPSPPKNATVQQTQIDRITARYGGYTTSMMWLAVTPRGVDRLRVGVVTRRVRG
jgi:hypothetical protein